MSEQPARWSAEVPVKVQFYDLDPMQVVWHGNYARFFELGRCAVLDTIDYGYQQMKASGFAWPVIDMHVRYLQPTTMSQELIVRADIVEWENRLKLQYLIRDAQTGMRLTKGSSVQVAVDMTSGLMCLQSPPVLFERLGIPMPW
jgi:acyl-CoA thioester hydrolase